MISVESNVQSSCSNSPVKVTDNTGGLTVTSESLTHPIKKNKNTNIYTLLNKVGTYSIIKQLVNMFPASCCRLEGLAEMVS